MDSDKINKGNKITKQFPAGQFSELENLRKGIKLLMSKLDYQTLSEIDKLIYDEFMAYNNKVEGFN